MKSYRWSNTLNVAVNENSFFKVSDSFAFEVMYFQAKHVKEFLAYCTAKTSFPSIYSVNLLYPGSLKM